VKLLNAGLDAADFYNFCNFHPGARSLVRQIIGKNRYRSKETFVIVVRILLARGASAVMLFGGVIVP
jgi:hypothetical protein